MPRLDMDSGRSSTEKQYRRRMPGWLSELFFVLCFLGVLGGGIAGLFTCARTNGIEARERRTAKFHEYADNAKIACTTFCGEHGELFAINHNEQATYSDTGYWALECVCNDGVTIDAPNRF